MIDLAPHHLELVRRILGVHLPGIEVRAFGSRVRGTARPFSDLDLAVVGDGPLPMDQLEALRDAFSASDLPILVDVLDEHAVSPAFRARIDACFEVVQTARLGPP
ncbi:nucleotidyltransferase domain-containing protein [Myxococcota bacterium]|nr:nucleotidyltransferase domain-containing protein [Myxococcota bacterium]